MFYLPRPVLCSKCSKITNRPGIFHTKTGLRFSTIQCVFHHAGGHPQHPETEEALSEAGLGHGLLPDKVKGGDTSGLLLGPSRRRSHVTWGPFETYWGWMMSGWVVVVGRRRGWFTACRVSCWF